MKALALVVLLAVPAGGADAPAVDGKAAFARLKDLAGTWSGHIVKPDGPPGTVRYEVASGGTIVIETLFPGDPHEMRTVYHMDGDKLVATHYCSAGNQPRFALVKGGATGDLVFDYAGGTNVDPAKDGHVHGGTIRVVGDELNNEWLFFKDGKQAAAHRFFLKRQ